jgi:hypothetical protein
LFHVRIRLRDLRPWAGLKSQENAHLHRIDF